MPEKCRCNIAARENLENLAKQGKHFVIFARERRLLQQALAGADSHRREPKM
jgi:hypothetical protein